MLRRLLSCFAAVVAMLFLFALPAQAQQRIALVIGNAAYAKGPLKTSLADGGLVAEALTSIGFEIVEGADVNQADLRRLFQDFLAKVEAAGPDTIAVVYYSGYGLEFEGDNYLVPVDAKLERDSDIPIDAIRLFDVLRPLGDLPAAAKIVILDATRPLPFQIQGSPLAPGLGAIATVPGMLIAFSSSPGMAAEDGPGPYGAYATAIAEMVREPGLDLDTMFARIRLRTNEATNGTQTPWNVSQDMNPQLFLVPPAAAAPGAPAVAPAPVARAPRPMRDVGPDEAYELAIQDDNLDGYTEYVQTYPNSPYAPRIWAIIRERREALVWRRALLTNTPEAYWTYLQRYPGGMYSFDAERRLRRLSAGDRPPPGFRMLDFDDVPMPLPDEPARRFDVFPPGPPPPRFLGPRPSFIVDLPPPARGPGRGLLHRQQTFPVLIAPRGGPRPGLGVVPTPGGPLPGGPKTFQKGPAIITQPGPGGPLPGPKGFRKGAPITTETPTGPKRFEKLAPTTTQTPTGPKRFEKLAPTTTQTPTGPKRFEKVSPTITQTPSKGPSQLQQEQFHKGTTQQQQQQIKGPTPPRPPPPPPPPPPPKGPPPPSRTPPPGAAPAAKKCVVVNGQQVCK